MRSTNPFSCFLIGADTLLIECGEILLAKGHRILGVITTAPRLRQWAEAKGILVLASDSDYSAALREQPFDYLFSITHLEIIRDDVVRLPEQMAINFHDGPLPAYAGLNAPAWALINQEQRYGITWHQLTEGVDEGNVLKQAHFDIAKNETSISLNTKCFAAALETFPQLVDELSNGTTQPIVQDLEQRTYFSKFQRPPAAALLQWQRPATELVALVRAMDFGEYPNPLCLPKMIIRGQPFAVTSGQALDEPTSEHPGTVLKCAEDQIAVATGNAVLSITQVKELTGNPLELAELIRRTNLMVGDRLETFSEDELNKLTSYARRCAKAEPYWRKQLLQFDPTEAPLANRETSVRSDQPTYQTMTLDTGTLSDPAALVAAFAVLLAKFGRKSEFDVAFKNQSLSQPSDSLSGLVAASSLLRLSIDGAWSVSQAVEKTQQGMQSAESHGSWMADLIGRSPELRAIPQLAEGSDLAVGVSLGGHHPIAGCALTLAAAAESTPPQIIFDQEQISPEAARKLADHLQTIYNEMQENPEKAVAGVQCLDDQQRQQLLSDWNDTGAAYDDRLCVHQLFEQQAHSTPNRVALIFRGQELSYAELNSRADQVAAHLRSKRLEPDQLVGIYLERSIDLVVATLGILKAGAAYVPLDPAFPTDRIAYMVDDAKMRLVITSRTNPIQLSDSQTEVVDIENCEAAANTDESPGCRVSAENLAYVIYTSGSTGKPKGVMVEHRNVTNFFVGMDQCIDSDPPGCWLAVTSLSFDISVLELLWTLTRGFKVVIYREDRSESSSDARSLRTPGQSNRGMDFGLFMWGNDAAPGREKYQLLLDGAKYFDENGFQSVWTPERHFAAFGGPYPNPAVTSAAVAAITQNISIRCGSIVSPLHHPVRIAEDWSVVDNLSDGRVGLSFAAGWQPNDFVIMPQNHKNNKQVMIEQIDTVRRLWRGEKVKFANPFGDQVEIATLPRPVQSELPIWLTTAGNPETYRLAGSLGVNVLTHLLGQTLDELAEKIRIYRQARQDAGFDPNAGSVTLMLHTFVGNSDAEVRELVRQPMIEYLRSSMKLVLDFAWSFPAFKRPGGQTETPDQIDIKSLTAEETDTILDFAFERYYETSGLFGTPEMCLEMVERCKSADVDEIACLLDFGAETQKVLDHLPLLKEVRDLANTKPAEDNTDSEQDQSLAAQIERYDVTHFQCTPSMARMLTLDPAASARLRGLKHMMVGGEAFPESLAKELKRVLRGRLTNMYGPTETTIWSTTQEVEDPQNIPIGRPIANTQLYILDADRQLVPPGVPGDLFIGGQGVVRGYLNRPELTSERFIANPHAAGSRIYWTGDLARYRDDGVVEYLGRTDHQVKIRGYRIELGEIETAICRHDDIGESVVLVREDTPGDQRLVAYIVLGGQSKSAVLPDSTQLREFLRQALPDYMLPNDVVALSELPLTPNGKIDRRQLPAPDSNSKSPRAEFVPPEDGLQETIAEIWQDTLKVPNVGINDNFFDLGGHSLLIVRVHQMLKSKVEQPIALTDLYRFPTINTLANFLTAGDSASTLTKSSDRAARRRERLGLRRRSRR